MPAASQCTDRGPPRRQHGCTYGKLKPWAVESASLAAESEGQLCERGQAQPRRFCAVEGQQAGGALLALPMGPGTPRCALNPKPLCP